MRAAQQPAREAEHRFPVRIRIGISPEGLGNRLGQMNTWLDANCGADGWTSTPSSTRGVVNDALAICFADATLASAFVARWCAMQRVEVVDGVYLVRDDEPTPRVWGYSAQDALKKCEESYPRSMQLTAYLDEAGTHAGTRLTVMAGWVADEDRWNNFEAQWTALLHRNGISHVHGTDLQSGKGPFKGWPRARRAALAGEIAELCTRATLFGLVTILDNMQYDRIYIGDNAEMRKKRSALDSKYGVCFRVAISLIPRLIERANLADGSALAVVMESGHQNVGAAPEIFRAFNELAHEPIRSLLKRVAVEEKRDSAGLQAADMLAYPAWRGETDNTLVYQDVDLLADDSPLSLPVNAPFRVPIKPETLTDLREGTLVLPRYRRQLRRQQDDGKSE